MAGGTENAGPARFQAMWPGNSPYVTGVGATNYAESRFNLTMPPPVCSDPHIHCMWGGAYEEVAQVDGQGWSGGGFSDVNPAPAYQTAAIAAYIGSGVVLPDQSLWNRTGRASPDLSAIGLHGYIVHSGRRFLVGGTSMSAPIVAAIVALLQADYYTITNTSLGFLNQLLYKGQAAGAGLFNDIVVGDNCVTPRCFPTQDGFRTAKGWDPVTGLGTPQYPAMKAYVQKLGRAVVARRSAQLSDTSKSVGHTE